MSNRFPLTIDTATNTIEELPSGDNLDLSGSNINAVGNIIAGNSVSANYFVGDLYGQANTAVSATTAGTVTTNAQPNITSVGNLSSLTVTGNSDLGNISNVKIAGGTSDQLIKTDGNGNLSFTTVQGDSYMLEPVVVATVTNITLSGTQSIDGVTVQVGDRVLVWRQSTGSQNGIYIVDSGSWTRATDFDTGSNTLRGGVTVTPKAGTNLHGVTFVCTNTTAITIGSTSIAWERSQLQGILDVWTATNNDQKATVNGSGGVALGVLSYSGTDGTAMGYNANAVDRSAAYGYGTIASAQSIAMGVEAKAGTYSVSLGRAVLLNAGSYPSFCVDIGYISGRTANSSGANRVSVGAQAHELAPGANSVAVGYNAGRNNAHANTIVINATGANLDTNGASRAFMKPIREVTDITGLKAIYYDPTTGELVYYTP